MQQPGTGNQAGGQSVESATRPRESLLRLGNSRLNKLGGASMPVTKEDLEEAMREWISAWNNNDIQAIATMEAGEVGFGYRTEAGQDRSRTDENEFSAILEEFFGRIEYFHLKLEDLQTSVVGNIGLAWGVFTEDFQEKGRPTEYARVRFSSTLSKGAQGWQVLMFHRDIQPFEEDGTYPRELTLRRS